MESPVRRRPRSRFAALGVVFLAAGMLEGIPAYASDAPVDHASTRPAATPARDSYVRAGCGTVSAAARTSGRVEAVCFAEHPASAEARPALEGPPSTALAPSQLVDAYRLPTGLGAGSVIAIVDAGGYANAESDLSYWREYYGLPACTSANGCFAKFDQRGGTDYPGEDPGWSIETALDLDAVSAICPLCKIDLIEGDSSTGLDLAKAAQTAAHLPGVVAVSNSYGVPGEASSEQDLDPYYDTPGIAMVAATGDIGNVTSYPAASPNVLAVGGTHLVADPLSARGWDESAWSNGGSGCSAYEPQPAYQSGLITKCTNRAIADIAAEGDPSSGIAIYNTSGQTGWQQYGGTSLATPLIAAMIGLAGPPVPGTYEVTYPYTDPNASDDLHDITSGSDGSCGSLLCTAGTGWDGPTGLGTPNGIGALTRGPHGFVAGTVTDGSGAAVAGATINVTAGGHSYHVASGADGTYSLPAPVGTYDLTATKFGYDDVKITDVTIAKDATVTRNITMTAQPTHVVTGTVTDGGGHGWPLYAKIMVDGDPDGTTFTNPTTGRYQLRLPDGHRQLQISSAYATGYGSSSPAVDLNTDQTLDVALPVDPNVCSGSAGYHYSYAGTGTDFEDFAGKSPTEGWTVVDNEPATETDGINWEFDDPHKRGNMTPGSGNFAVIDGDHYGPGTKEDSSLISPTADVSSIANPSIEFDTMFADLPGTWADVDLSLDGGATWSNVWESKDDGWLTGHVSIPIPQANGGTQVKVRFHYHADDWGMWWQVDNAVIGSRTCVPTAGGVAAGFVTDDNTGEGVAGVTVADRAAPAYSTATVATPEDPANDDGYFQLFHPAGPVALRATAGRYTPATLTATVTDDTVTPADLVLKAGHLSLSTTSISATTAYGGRVTKTVTLSNDGSEPVAVKLNGEYQRYTSMETREPTPLITIAGEHPIGSLATYTGTNATPPTTQHAAGSTWTPLPDMADDRMDGGAVTIDGKVYVVAGIDRNKVLDTLSVYDPVAGDWTDLSPVPMALEEPSVETIGNKIYVVGGWNAGGDATRQTYAYDPASDTWATLAPAPFPVAGAGAAVLGGRLYLIGGCPSGACNVGSSKTMVYDPAANAWTRAADYPSAKAFSSCGGVTDEVVCAGGLTPPSATGATVQTWAYNPANDTWTERTPLPAGIWGAATTTSNGRLQLYDGVVDGQTSNQAIEYNPGTDQWQKLPNTDHAVYRSAAACGAYVLGGSTSGFHPQRFAEVLGGYDQCTTGTVPWLKTSQTSFTIAPGDQTTVTLTLDSVGVAQPGTYTGGLTVLSDSPYAYPEVGTTFTVTPPATWAKVAGTVTDSSGAPLPGATVVLCSNATAAGCGPVTYTLTTDPKGRYSVWLDQSYSRLLVTAASAGLATQSRTVALSGGITTTVDFKLIKPRNLSPSLVTATLSSGRITTASQAHVIAHVISPAGVPTGTITVHVQGSGQTHTLTATLTNGTATATLPRLPRGNYIVWASYGGSATIYPATSSTTTLAVAAAQSILTATLRSSKVSTGTRATVNVKASCPAATPIGSVVIRLVHKGRTRTVTASLSGGRTMVKLPRLRRGRYQVWATYGGSSMCSAATSPTRVLTVVQRR